MKSFSQAENLPAEMIESADEKLVNVFLNLYTESFPISPFYAELQCSV